MSFSVSYDRATKIISVAVCAGLAVLAVAVPEPWLAVLSAAIVALAWAWSPRGYEISQDTIRVRRLIGPVVVPLAGLREVRRAAPDDFRRAIRLFGSGGLFGYYGLFSTRTLGRSSWYVTDRSRAVVVITAAKTAVFSPDDVDGFLAAIGAPETPTAAPSAASPLPLRGILVAAGIAFAIASLFYSPGLPGYTLTRSTLAIHDTFYPVTLGAHDVDIGGIRVVDLREEPGWRPTMRTGGFGNLRYHSGWFRVANGKRIRLYRESGQRVVLLPARNGAAPVLLQVQAPEEFVQQIRREWRN